MKRTVITLAGVATLGIAAYVGSYLRADPPAGVSPASATAPAAPLRTRVAVVNLNQVIKTYEKFKQFDENLKKYFEDRKVEFERKKAPLLDLKNKVAQPGLDEKTREQYQQQIRALERELQDFEEAVKKAVTKYEADNLVQLYGEINDAVERYARAYDIEMVLQYNDMLTKADREHPANVQRKMQMMGFLPMYVASGMDITDAIVSNLNQRLKMTTSPTTPSK